MTEFPNAVKLHSKLKSMLWYDQAGRDGVIYHAISVDDYTVCDSRIYIRYDVEAPTDREECYALIQFPGGGVIRKKVDSFEHGLLWCESRREIFWNELWRTITEEIFVKNKEENHE